ncbi:MAG: type II toxin-antitoxin system RelE/ParE family toxin [Pirellulales bacterium]
MPYRVELIPAAVRQMSKLPRRDQQRIRDAIDELSQNPRPQGAKKLTGLKNVWRVRAGDYRVLYEIHDDRLVVLVIRVAHRKDVYRKGN